MKSLEIEHGDKNIEIDIYDNSVEVTIYQEYYTWNGDGKAIAADIILNKNQAMELKEFLNKYLLTPAAE